MALCPAPTRRRFCVCGVLALGIAVGILLIRQTKTQPREAIKASFLGFETNSAGIRASFCISNQAAVSVHLYNRLYLERRGPEPLLGINTSQTNLPRGGFVLVSVSVPDYFDSDWRLGVPWKRASDFWLGTQVVRVVGPRTNLAFLFPSYYSWSEWVIR